MEELKNIVEVKIGFNIERDKIAFIDSDFMDERYNFKNPIDYTTKLIQMALEKWIRDKIGIFCPKCDKEFKEGWTFCPVCGWNANE